MKLGPAERRWRLSGGRRTGRAGFRPKEARLAFPAATRLPLRPAVRVAFVLFAVFFPFFLAAMVDLPGEELNTRAGRTPNGQPDRRFSRPRRRWIPRFIDPLAPDRVACPAP